MRWSVGMRIVNRVYDARLEGKKIWWFPKIDEVSGFILALIIDITLLQILLLMIGVLYCLLFV